jgi:hypothetical protein
VNEPLFGHEQKQHLSYDGILYQSKTSGNFWLTIMEIKKSNHVQVDGNVISDLQLYGELE